MKWVRREISGIKETLKEMASKAREDKEKIISMFEELDFAGIKESLDKMTYDSGRRERIFTACWQSFLPKSESNKQSSNFVHTKSNENVTLPVHTNFINVSS